MENNKNSEREARVDKEYQQWKERYEIPFKDEFNVKTLLQLQDEFNSLSYNSGMTKTRTDLIYMIERLNRNLDLKKRTPVTQRVLILTENILSIKSILDLLFEKTFIKYRVESKDSSEIGLYNGTEVLICNKNYIQIKKGIKRFDYYLNLTNDKQFENDVIVKLLVK